MNCSKDRPVSKPPSRNFAAPGFGVARSLGFPVWLTLAVAVGSGCAHRPVGEPLSIQSSPGNMGLPVVAERQSLERMWPPDFRAVQRAVITVGRKQYVTDGLLTASRTRGLHLAVISPLGLVTEVACRADGRREVLRTTPLFPRHWARDYVARDLEWLYHPATNPIFSGQLQDGRHVLETQTAGTRRRYVVATGEPRIEELEGVTGGRRVYHARFGRWQTVPNWPVLLPTAIQVDAGVYRLSLQLVQLSVPALAPAKAP